MVTGSMRRRTGWAGLLAVTVLAAAGCGAASGPAPSVGGWGPAQQVTGAGQAARYGAQVSVLSCPSPGDCSAGGSATLGKKSVPFVAGESGGVWGQAQLIPGLAALGPGDSGSLAALSCGAPGDCAAGGLYAPGGTGYQTGFVVAEQHGVWGQAQAVPGLARLNTSDADVAAVSCPAAGDCVVAGNYGGAGATQLPFVISESGGVWDQAQPIPGLAGPHVAASVAALSCPAVGSCVAVGSDIADTDRVGTGIGAFVATETGGVWSRAQGVASLLGLPGRDVSAGAVSCSAPGDCGITGSFTDGARGYQQPFVATESGAGWHVTQLVSTGEGLDLPGVTLISCSGPGDCTAAGNDETGSLFGEVAVITETHGVWGLLRELAGYVSYGEDSGQLTSLSCAAPGDCAAVGGYNDSRLHQRAFVATETHGVWGRAEQAPGSAGIGDGDATTLTAVSCPAVHRCTAGGGNDASGRNPSGTGPAFVLSQS